MKIFIREATSSESTEIASLFLSNLNTQNKILVAIKDEQILGYIEVSFLFEDAEILNIEIVPEFRHIGIATKLIDYALDFLKKNSIKNIFLEVMTTNEIAINLYKKFNFAELTIRKNYYQNPLCDAIVMKKVLLQ